MLKNLITILPICIRRKLLSKYQESLITTIIVDINSVEPLRSSILRRQDNYNNWRNRSAVYHNHIIAESELLTNFAGVFSSFIKVSEETTGCGAVGPVTLSVTRILEKFKNQRFSDFSGLAHLDQPKLNWLIIFSGCGAVG